MDGREWLAAALAAALAMVWACGTAVITGPKREALDAGWTGAVATGYADRCPTDGGTSTTQIEVVFDGQTHALTGGETALLYDRQRIISAGQVSVDADAGVVTLDMELAACTAHGGAGFALGMGTEIQVNGADAGALVGHYDAPPTASALFEQYAGQSVQPTATRFIPAQCHLQIDSVTPSALGGTLLLDNGQRQLEVKFVVPRALLP